MPTLLAALHPAIAIMKLSGEGVRDYLQGQLTQDVRRLSPQLGIHAALLTPQGKAAGELELIEGNRGDLIMLVPAVAAEAMVARLRNFALGYKLRIGIVGALGVLSLQGEGCNEALAALGLPAPAATRLSVAGSSAEELFVLRLPEAATDGVWIVADCAHLADLNAQLDGVDELLLEQARIRHGHPRFGAEWDGSEFPLNCNLLEFDGVSFDKGCYVGQEVTARMRWRGGIRKRLYRVGSAAALSAPQPLLLDGRNIGELRAADGMFGIAQLTIAEVGQGGEICTADGVALALLGACSA